MKTYLWLSIVATASLALASCATWRPNAHNARDPFVDSGQYESLASGPFETNAKRPPTPTVWGTSPDRPSLVSMPEADRHMEALANPEASVVPIARLQSSVEAELKHAIPEETKPSSADAIATPADSYAALVRGNERFVNGESRASENASDRRRALANLQRPHAVVLSCSDSRVPPELVFDQGLGDLLSVRVAGNVLGSAQVASIEYAVSLGAKLIVVLGHESCGAVRAAIDHAKAGRKSRAESLDLDWLAGAIEPNIGGRKLASVSASFDSKLRKPVMANVDAVSETLLLRSKIVSKAVAEGRVKLVRGIYSLDSGRVDFWGLK